MTKMTVLHFASPFAFSMPVPVRATTLRIGTAKDEATDLESSATGTTLWLASASDGIEAGAPERAGPAASPYDTVLLRYREQTEAGSDTSAATEIESSFA